MLWNVPSSVLKYSFQSFVLSVFGYAGVEREETDTGHHEEPSASAATGPTIKSSKLGEFTIIIIVRKF